jgi:membrane protease YdiL (CAAX protease family)
MRIREAATHEIAPFRERFDAQTAIILLSASLLPTIYRYYGWSTFFDRHFRRVVPANALAHLYGRLYLFGMGFILLLVVPLLVTVFVLKKKPREFGAQIGDWRAGLTIVGVLFPLIALIMLWPASHDPAFRAEYPLYREAGQSAAVFVMYALCYALYYLGWESFFRGFLLFGLKDTFGSFNSILIQTIPSTLLHIGKPDGEIIAAILAGVLFGAIALRTRSVLYVFLLHWFIGVGLDVFIVLSPGSGA